MVLGYVNWVVKTNQQNMYSQNLGSLGKSLLTSKTICVIALCTLRFHPFREQVLVKTFASYSFAVNCPDHDIESSSQPSFHHLVHGGLGAVNIRMNTTVNQLLKTQ